MSAAGVTDALVAAIESGKYDFIVANFANPDMVGHTGVWDATVLPSSSSMAALAASLRNAAARAADGLLCITADHGNADEKGDSTASR